MLSGQYLAVTPRWEAGGRLSAIIAAVATSATGLMVLVGWILDLHALKAIIPGFATMKANTAIGFVLAGTALGLYFRRPGNRTSRMLGGLVAAIGLASLAEYLFTIDLRIDQLIFQDLDSATFPGRLSAVTALNFSLLGLALVFLQQQRWRLADSVLILPVAVLCVIALAGYAFGARSLYTVPGFGSLALHTAFSFTLLCWGMVIGRPNLGALPLLLSEWAASPAIRRLVLSVVVIPLVLGELVLLGQRSGLFDPVGGLAVFACAMVVVLFLVVLWTARSLFLLDSARLDATGKLEVKESQLRHAQRMEAVGRLAGGVAHDFNNALNVVLGYAQLLQARFQETDPAYSYVAEIRKASERAADIAHQLLAFSRKQVLEPVVLDVNEVVSGMDKMLRRLIGEDIEWATSMKPKLGNVRADRGQLEQVLMNLAVNARDAMPIGGKLTLETGNVDLDEAYAGTHPEVVPGPYVMMAVTDTGIGMTPEVLAHIFEPFFTTKERGKGTGLGLSTVFGIVKQSGGHVWVYSEPGHGSTFKIYLPRVEDALATVVDAVPEPSHKGGSETILVVEDEPPLRTLIALVLNDHGYRVLEAGRASEALSVVQQHSGAIPLLLTDMILPGESGRALANQLVGMQPSLKVVFMSGYTEDTILHHGALEAGVLFLAKPFTAAALLEKVRKALDEGQAIESR